MAEIKNTFLKGKMNKDLDERLVPQGEYRDAMNVEVSTSEGSNVGTVQNILGNIQLQQPGLINEGASCIGSVSDEKNNRLYWFVTSENVDVILEWDDLEQKSSLVFVDPNKKNSNATLKFPNTHITGINILDDFLLWTDGFNEPKKINIKDSKLGTDQIQAPTLKHTELIVNGFTVKSGYVNEDGVEENQIVTEQYITVIKKRPQLPPTVKINTNKNKSEKGIFEKVLPRFCYRYKYKDGEYSAYGPFTNVVFSAEHQDTINSTNFYSIEENRNASMANSIESVELLDFVPSDIPKDVIQIDLLYKSENSNVVYSVANVKRQDKEFDLPGSAQNVEEIYFGNFLSETNKGRYLITTENIYAALPENQLLRSWDNVPKSAKAQEVSGSRVVYANYKQGYDLKQSVILNSSYEKRNTRQNDLQLGGVETVKSLRDYQLGVVWGDEQGRETPVFSSSNSSVKVPWLNERYSTPNYYLPLCITGALETQAPDWASYFKFYIKETSGEYYNLLMDKLYIPSQSTDFDNKEDHVWLSFPSSEINKITEQDYLILKRVSSSTINPVEEKSRYKVIDISTEAPDSIAYNYFSIGEASNVDSATNDILANTDEDAAIFPNADRRIDKETDVIEIDRSNTLEVGIPLLRAIGNADGNSGVDNSSDVDELYVAWKQVSSGVTTHSKRYKVISNEFVGTSYKMKLSEKITEDDALLAANNASSLNQDLVFSIFRKQLRDGENFSGKFFVKIKSDDIIKNKILNLNNNISSNKFISSSRETFWFYDTRAGGSGETESILNAPALGSLPNVISNNATENIVNGVSNTSTEWDNILINKDKAFFIDNMFMTAANVCSNSYAKEAGQGVIANPMQYGEVEWKSNFNTDEDEYPWSLNAETTWSQSDAPAVDWGSTVQNFIPGVITSNADHIDEGKYVWKKSIFDSQENTKTYGEEAGGFFMHVSFLAPGKNLHDGSFDGAANLDNVEVFGENSLAGLLKGIWGGGAFTDEFGGPLGQDAEGNDVKFVELEGNYLEENPLGDAPGPGIGKGYDLEYREHHERQWDPTFAPSKLEVGIDAASQVDKDLEDFVKNLAIGKKFKFQNDTTEQLYTILDVSIKHVYNHTPWRSKLVYTNTGEVARGGDSVEEAAVAWAKAKLTNTLAGEDTSLVNKIVDFGKASNRRTVYILRLDKDPVDASQSPVAGSATDINFSLSQKMQFVDSDAQVNSGLIKDVEAVFETEPKEALDLNIFYEASQAIPTYLNLENANQFAPIGCRVEFVDLPDARVGENNISETIHIAEWKHTDSGELAFVCQQENGAGPNARGFNKKRADGVEIDYVDARVRFYRPDGSFTTCRLGPMQAAGQGASGLRRLFIVNRVVYVTQETGLGWFNCFTFGDGVESNRIEDDFNASFIKNGARASTTLDEPYSEEHRKYGLIYSGLYNASSGLNNLNQFIQAEKITKDLNPTYGSIQKLFSRRADLIAFCEDRVIKILANKDAVFNADGNPQLVATTNVLGQATPFVGDYGISTNPESFSAESYRAYFTDKQRGAVLRLSMDGLTPISDAGMHDFFRDELPKAGVVLGTYDEYKRQYNVTFKDFVYNNIIKNSYLAEGEELNISNDVTEIIRNPLLDSGINYVASDINTIYQDAVDSGTELLLNTGIDAGVIITYFPGIAAGDITAYQAQTIDQPAVYEDTTVPNYGPIVTTINAGGTQQYQTNQGELVTTQDFVAGVFPVYDGFRNLFRREEFSVNLDTDGITSSSATATVHAPFYVNLTGADFLATSSSANDSQSRGGPSPGGFALNNEDSIQIPSTAVDEFFSNQVQSAVRAQYPDATDWTIFNGEELAVKINYRVEFYKANQNQWSNDTCSQANAAPNMDITLRLIDGTTGNADGFRSVPGSNIGIDNYVGASDTATSTNNPWTSFGGSDTNSDNFETANASFVGYSEYSWANSNKRYLYSPGGALNSYDCSFTWAVPGVLVDGDTLSTAAYVDANSTQEGYESENDTVSVSTGATQNNLYGQRYTSSGGYRWYTEHRSMIVKFRIFKDDGSHLANNDIAIQKLEVHIEPASTNNTSHKLWVEGFYVFKVNELDSPGVESISEVQQAAAAEYDVITSTEAFGDVDGDLQVEASVNGQSYGTLSQATDEFGNVGSAQVLGDIVTEVDGTLVSAATFLPEVLAFPDVDLDPFVVVEHINPSDWAGSSSDGRVNLTAGIEEVYGPDNSSQVQLKNHTDELGNSYSYFALEDSSGNAITDNGVTFYSAANNGTTITTYSGSSVDDGYYLSIPTQETLSVDSYVSVVGYEDGDITLNTSSAKITQGVNLIHGNWYAVDVELEDDGYQITNETTNISVNGGRLLLYGAITPALSVAAYTASHLNPGTNYPAGMFGQIHNVACVRFMPITVNYGGEQREVFRVVFQANQETSNGLSTLEVGAYGNDTAINVTRIDLIDVTLADSSGNNGTFSLNWDTSTTNSLVTALDVPVSYYQNGGWVWDLYENENAQLNTITQDLEGNLTEATVDGYTLSFQITNAPDYDATATGQINGVEGELQIHAVTEAWEDGQHRVISVTGINTYGTNYSIPFNLDGSAVDIESISQPVGSNIQVSLTTVAAEALEYAEDQITILPGAEGFYGRLTQISIQDDSEIVSGGNTDSWIFTSYDTASLESNPIQASSEYRFEDEQITFDDAPENIQVSQSISEDINEGETYEIAVDVQHTQGEFDIYYFSKPGVGFVIPSGANPTSGVVTRTVEQSEYYQPGMITGALVFVTTDSLNTFSLDNITMTRVATNEVNKKTISYSEDVNGWVSFKSYYPESGVNVSKKYFTFNEGKIHQHYHQDAIANTFYNQPLVESQITTVLNAEPGVIKTFKTLVYEGSQAKINKHDSMGHDVELYNLIAKDGWRVESIKTNLDQGSVKEFVEKENKWFNYIKGIEYSSDTVAENLANLNFQGVGILLQNPVLMLEEEEDLS